MGVTDPAHRATRQRLKEGRPREPSRYSRHRAGCRSRVLLAIAQGLMPGNRRAVHDLSRAPGSGRPGRHSASQHSTGCSSQKGDAACTRQMTCKACACQTSRNKAMWLAECLMNAAAHLQLLCATPGRRHQRRQLQQGINCSSHGCCRRALSRVTHPAPCQPGASGAAEQLLGRCRQGPAASQAGKRPRCAAGQGSDVHGSSDASGEGSNVH